MVLPSRNDWRKFSSQAGSQSQRTTHSQQNPVKPPSHTQEEPQPQPVLKDTRPRRQSRMGTALQQRAVELKMFSVKSELNEAKEDKDKHVVEDAVRGIPDVEMEDTIDEDSAMDAREGCGFGSTLSSQQRQKQHRRPSPLLSAGLLPPATHPEQKDSIAHCLSTLPTARTALHYASQHGRDVRQSAMVLGPPGKIRIPGRMMPQTEKLSIESSIHEDSEGRQGCLYDPITVGEASEPQQGTEPSLGQMGGFYDNSVKAYTPSGRQQAWMHHDHKYGQWTPPSKKRELPAHDTSSPAPALALTPLTRLRLSSYLAEAVCSNGIASNLFPHELYEWQADCLGKDSGICGGLRKNLVVSAPTSSGKTLLAEILMLRALGDDQQVLKQSRKALFVLPYVALCEEKARRLQELILPLSRQVKKAYGGQHSKQMWEPETGIIVCTPENANSMINRLIEEGTPIEDEICCVVVDELHLVGRDDRGTVLEMLLSKIAFLSKLIKHPNANSGYLSHQEQNMTPTTPVTQNTLSDRFLQIVGLTATMPNIEEIGRWLDAVPYSCDFRPVELREYIKEQDGTVKRKEKTGLVEAGKEYDLYSDRVTVLPPDKEDPDHVGFLTHEAVTMGKSVMIFCASKKRCQVTAKALVSYFRRHAEATAVAGGALRMPQPSEEAIDVRKKCAHHIGKGTFEYSKALAEVILQGACFHHGDLVPHDRKLVEDAFRDGHIKVLCATSTLSTGVNLPIFRLIFKDAFQGLCDPTTYISQETYRQISGRAGRTGIDAWGESFLIVSKDSRNRVPKKYLQDLLLGRMDRIVSSVVVGGVLSRERCDRLLLEMLATAQARGHVIDETALNMIMESTLVWAAANSEKRVEIASLVERSMEWLATNFSSTTGQKRRFHVSDIDNSPMIQRRTVEGLQVTEVTLLGKAVVASNMAPHEALLYMKDLNVALNQGFVTGNHLHVLYMCVPLTCTQITMSKTLYGKLYSLVEHADPIERRVHEILGLSQAFLALAKQNDKLKLKGPDDERQARICHRLFIAYMLYSMILGASPSRIIKDFGISSGKLLDSLKEDVERFGKKAASLCRSMGKDVIAGSLREFASEVRKANDESFQKLVECGIERRDAVFLIHLDVNSAEEIVEKGRDELVKLLHSAYAVEGREPDTARLQAKAAKIVKAAEKALKPPSQLTMITGAGGMRSKGRASSPVAGTKSAVAAANVGRGIAAGAGKDCVSQEVQGQYRLVSGGEVVGMDRNSKGDKDAKVEMSANYQRVLDAIVSDEPIAIYMHASNLVDKKGRRSADTEMPKGLKPKPPDRMPIGIGFSWSASDEYVSLKGKSDADAFVSKLKEALSRRSMDAYIAMMGWHNQISILEGLVGLDLAQLMNVKLACWILEPDRYEVLVTNKFKKPSSSFIGKKRNREQQPKANQLKIRQTYQTASFETEAHEYCREILKLLDTEGTFDHYPDMIVVEEGSDASSLYLKITRKMLRCMRSMLPVLERTGVLRPLMETEMPICRIIGEIEERGCGFDGVWLHQEQKRLLEVTEQVSKRAAVVLQADTGESVAVDLASTSQLSAILYQRPYYALPPPEINKIRHKYHSTSKDALLELRNKYPNNRFIPLISLYRSLQDLSSTITTLGRFKDGDGKIRTHFLQTSAGTGRVATDEPNLQCLQKRKVLAFDDIRVDISMRKAIVPPTKGRVILSADFKHIEFRVMSHLAEDSSMQAIMRQVDADPFKLLACEWKKDQFSSPEDVTKKDREHAKMLCYALIYGMGESRLGAELGIKPAEAAATRRSFLDKFPSMAHWIDREVRAATERRHVITLNHRIRWLDDIRNEEDGSALAADQRAAVNSVCQGSAADAMKKAMIGVERRLKRDFGDRPPCACLLQIHDELLFEVDPDRMSEAVITIKEEMEGAWPGLAVPLLVTFRAGRSWGELEELETPYEYRASTSY